METKKISSNQHLALTRLHDTAGEFDIEVPAEGGHFHLEQVGGALTYRFHLRTPGSILKLTGLQRLDAGESTLNAEIIHHAPHSLAETRIRTLGRGTAKATFRGMIRIAPGAVGCESYLNHHSLLFDQARSWSWPALEIQNNEVKCSHAATIRTITDAELFYPRSRGIGLDDARNLLIDAFIADISL